MYKGTWRESGKQFIRFNLVGLLNTAIDFLLFTCLTWFGIYYLLAQLLAYAAGMANSLLLNSRFTFREQGGKKPAAVSVVTLVRFVVWNGLVLGLSLLLLAGLTEWLSLHELTAKVIVTVATVGINFYGSKKWVFAARLDEQRS